MPISGIGQNLNALSIPTGTSGIAGNTGLNNTQNFGIGAPPLAASNGQYQQGPMLMMMQMMMQMLQLIMSLLGGSQQQNSIALPPEAKAANAGVGQAGNSGNAKTSAPTVAAPPPPVVAPLQPTGPVKTQSSNAKLQNSLEKIANDPEGRVLLAEAQRKGVSINVGDTGGQNVLGFFKPNGRGGGKIIVGDGDNLKTIVHELVHAVSSEDGNSQHEEGTANVIGHRITSRITGQQAPNSDSIYNRTLPLYKNLQRTNGIENTLGRLGITA